MVIYFTPIFHIGFNGALGYVGTVRLREDTIQHFMSVLELGQAD